MQQQPLFRPQALSDVPNLGLLQADPLTCEPPPPPFAQGPAPGHRQRTQLLRRLQERVSRVAPACCPRVPRARRAAPPRCGACAGLASRWILRRIAPEPLGAMRHRVACGLRCGRELNARRPSFPRSQHRRPQRHRVPGQQHYRRQHRRQQLDKRHDRWRLRPRLAESTAFHRLHHLPGRQLLQRDHPGAVLAVPWRLGRQFLQEHDDRDDGSHQPHRLHRCGRPGDEPGCTSLAAWRGPARGAGADCRPAV